MSNEFPKTTPDMDEVSKQLHSLAKGLGYTKVAPTPLVSNFWASTFTPSSSEVIFRHLNSSNVCHPRVFALQPCIRLTDLHRIGDGWHKLFFHMASFMSLSAHHYDVLLKEIILFIAGVCQKSVSDFGFTCSTSDMLKAEDGTNLTLGRELLLQCGASMENVLDCPGTSNFQDASLTTAERLKVSMRGPKIEMFDIMDGGRFREIATFQISMAQIAQNPARAVFVLAIGLERLTAVRNGLGSFWQTSKRTRLASRIADKYLPTSLGNSYLGIESIHKCLDVIEAVYYARQALNEITSFPNRGVKNHFLRMERELVRLLSDVGIPLNGFVEDIISSNDAKALSAELTQLANESKRPEYTK